MRLFNALGLGLAVARARFLGRAIPFFVTFSVTNRCNQRCTYCGFHLRDKNELTTQQIEGIIDELALMGTRRLLLLGGEPLLRDDIGSLIRRCRNRGMLCVINSNGTLVPDRIAELRGLDQLDLSLDGGKQAHDHNRGTGSFERVMRAAETAREAKIPLQFCALLTPATIGELDELVRLARYYRCMVSVDFPYQPQGLSTQAKPAAVDKDLFRSAINKVIAMKRKGEPLLFSAKTYQTILEWSDYSVDRITDKDYLKQCFKGPRCRAGRYFGFIDTNADFYPCVICVGRDKALNCLRDGVRAAWDFAGRHSCRACFVQCQVETNYLFALDPEVIANIMYCVKKRD